MWPHVIRNGEVAVKIYKNKGNVRGENFPTFLLSYCASGKRQLRRFKHVNPNLLQLLNPRRTSHAHSSGGRDNESGLSCPSFKKTSRVTHSSFIPES